MSAGLFRYFKGFGEGLVILAISWTGNLMYLRAVIVIFRVAAVAHLALKIKIAYLLGLMTGGSSSVCGSFILYRQIPIEVVCLVLFILLAIRPRSTEPE